jgi:hypothetical protein
VANTSVLALIMTAAAVLAAGIGEEPVFEINRFTIDAGGGTSSTAGAFDLSGTIGQPDVGVLSGGGFTLLGGFWFGQSPCDCNQDGGVNLFDYDDFDACASGPGGGLVAPSCGCFDLDGDLDVDLRDAATFQRLFTGR